MALRINSNTASLNAQTNLSAVTSRVQLNFKHLSSGLRIATASDDAAGLAISERLRGQIRAYGQASRNANDGVSLLQTAEAGLNEVSNDLNRLKELVIAANTGTISDNDKDTLQNQLNQLVDEVDRVSQSVSFNRITLLDGQTTQVSFGVGIGNTPGIDSISVTLASIRASQLGITGLNIGSTGNATTVSAALTAIDNAIDTVSEFRGRLGGIENRINSTIANISASVESLTSADSRIRDVDVAAESADLTRNSIIQQAALAVLAQANLQPQAALNLLRG